MGSVRTVGWDGVTLDGAWTAELAGCGRGRRPVRAVGRHLAVDRRTRARDCAAVAWSPAPRWCRRCARCRPSRRPGTFVAIAGTDGYVGADAQPATEETPFADTFLGALCRDWEAAAAPAADLGVRLVLARTCVVIAPGAPALARLALPVRLLAGGRIGSGRQWFSWIHIADWVAAMRLRAARPGHRAGPSTWLARRRCHRSRSPGRSVASSIDRLTLPTPAFAVQLALGGQADLVLGSRRVSSARLSRAGMTFAWPDFESAARDALR